MPTALPSARPAHALPAPTRHRSAADRAGETPPLDGRREGRPDGGVRTREIWWAAWPVFAVFVLSNAAMPLYGIWQHRLGFTSGTLTVVYAAYMAGMLGALLVAGVAADRIGRKPVLIPALLAALAACLLYATAGSVAALFAARFLTGLAAGSAVSAGMAAVTDLAAGRRIGPLLAAAATALGAGTGPLLAGALSQTAPAPTVTVFAVEAVLLLTALGAVARMPLPGRRAGRRSGAGVRTGTSVAAGTTSAPRNTGTGPAASIADTGTGTAPAARNTDAASQGADGARAAGSWVRVPSVPRANRRHLALAFAAFVPGLTSTSFVLSLGPSLLTGLLGTTDRAVAGALAFVMFGAAVGAQFAVRRLAVRTMLLVSGAATVAAVLGLVTAVWTGALAPLAVAAVLAGAAQGTGQFGGLTLLGREVPAARRAEANAAFNAGGYLVAGALPVAAGYLSDAVGLSSGTTVFGLVVAALAVAGGTLVAARR
ncbi:MFS transporter [Streptomyces sp. NPDC003077]|uniref:MFS transporter n=1 Tax=Streptomyces sp. NPDC003077 TaxID=3154443 RepID=UPI0033A50B85